MAWEDRVAFVMVSRLYRETAGIHSNRAGVRVLTFNGGVAALNENNKPIPNGARDRQ